MTPGSRKRGEKEDAGARRLAPRLLPPLPSRTKSLTGNNSTTESSSIGRLKRNSLSIVIGEQVGRAGRSVPLEIEGLPTRDVRDVVISIEAHCCILEFIIRESAFCESSLAS